MVAGLRKAVALMAQREQGSGCVEWAWRALCELLPALQAELYHPGIMQLGAVFKT